jgi:hypothetical protein
MATVITTQTLVDSTTRTLIKVTGVGGTDANVRLVTAANLAYSMTANSNALLTLGDTVNAKPQYRTTIRRVFGQGQMTAGKYVMLHWRNDANTNILSFGDGSFDYNFASDGSIGSIPQPAVGNTTGDILFSSTAASTDAWTLFIDLRKDNRDYSAGQFADPIAFNRGIAAP